ncbi:ribosomal protein L14 (mitochondrion) [Naegleria fowleri]|uniref:Ribosomal protein L14 n=1 Tax=Naegleria fowleri TaxID=5763 RepID=M4H668_NAEFO|nr:ribosomal protein L14 [Naegleria fowleri]AFP72318.1 ribosomal protein L14 [Naegleria fowleri]AOS85640.1 ribosomal protein L14 [Naegleria fowleri]AOS85686.1 ribosomal protein L14 [Naegleria fowleri]UAT97086.1 ribosomal protein L14 [Naegleria fowleri]WND64456.1 50S ribosomal protein L14 [Naegleria fowleri]
MIGVKTRFYITDNSGAKEGECIKVLNKKYQHAKVGDFIVVAIKKVRLRKKIKVKLHDVRFGIIVRTKKNVCRYNGIHISFEDNAMALLDKNLNPIGNRVSGPLSYEIRVKKLMKLILISPSIF